MKPKTQLRVAIYEPSGIGGVCHYTHQLATGLAELGQDVTVVTNEGYELCHTHKQFGTYFLFKRSRLKSFLLWLIGLVGGQRGNEPTSGMATGDLSTYTPGVNGSPLATLRIVRLKLAFLKGALFFLWTCPDVIHLQGVVDRRQDYYFARLLKKLGFKIVYTAHDLLPHDRSTLADREALVKIYRLADRVIVHSESDKDEMARTFEIDHNKISFVPHGSNNLFYSGEDPSKEMARRELGIQNDKKVILFFGNIRSYKGLEYLIEAFKKVKDDVPNAVLLIAGSIYNGDPEGYRYYSDLIHQYRSHNSIICMNEYIPVEKVNHYFSASDVVVLPYVKTYTSGVLLTAYAAGRPVVVTDTGALKEVVEDGKSGYVVPAKNAKALEEAIIKTFRSSEHLETMGRYAKYLADTRYSWRTVASETIRVYRSFFDVAQNRTGEVQQPAIQMETTRQQVHK